MTGRGIDQILPRRGDPTLRESVVSDARTYVRLAEQTNGPIPTPVEFAWPWGEALALLDEVHPDVRVINLETSITTSSEFAPRKAVHYRMHPDNIGCVTTIRPDVCALANNHILDFGYQGLADTLRVLAGAEIRCAGAGLGVGEADRPAIVGCPGAGPCGDLVGRRRNERHPLRVGGDRQPGRRGTTFRFVRPHRHGSRGPRIGREAAGRHRAGVGALGFELGYEVDDGQIRFAHRLIDEGVDVVHGHSSHHPRPIEVYREKLILYGCGDTVDDYEGIGTYEAFRHELRLLYFASIERSSGHLTALRMMPMRMRRMRLEYVPDEDAEWLRAAVERMSSRFETKVRGAADGALSIAR